MTLELTHEEQNETPPLEYLTGGWSHGSEYLNHCNKIVKAVKIMSNLKSYLNEHQ
jgi:hypothetical protein